MISRRVSGDQYCTDSVAQIRTASGLQKSRLSLIDTYAKMSFAKLYDRKTPIMSARSLSAPGSTGST